MNLKAKVFRLFVSMLTVLLLQQNVEGQQRFAFPQMDATLVNIWFQAELGYTTFCDENVGILFDQWEEVRSQLLDQNSDKQLLKEFAIDIDHLLDEFPAFCQDNDFIQLSGNSYHLMWEFRLLRYFFSELEYPLDMLWDMYDIYEDIHFSVHDEMFGLLSWPEFLTRVQRMQERWSSYSHLTHWNEMADSGLHQEYEFYRSASKVEECMSYFIASLESDYRTAFELPCDELGKAIKSLIRAQTDLSHNSNALDLGGGLQW